MLKFRSHGLLLLLVGVWSGQLSAPKDAVAEPKKSPAVTKSKPIESGQGVPSTKQIETLLAQPAKLKLKGTTTFKELLDQLRQQHGLNVALESTYAYFYASQREQMYAHADETLQETFARIHLETQDREGWTPNVPSIASYGYPASGYVSPAPTFPSVTAPSTPPTYAAGSTYPPAPAETFTANKPPSETEPASPAKSEKKKKGTRPPQPETKGSPQKPAADKKEKHLDTSEQANVQLITQITHDFMGIQISLDQIDAEHSSIEQVLHHALRQLTNPVEIEVASEMPVSFTHAYDADLLIKNGTVFITSRINANLYKETRVYPISQFKQIDPEALSQVITHSVRPWSWRSQVNELIGQIEADWVGSFKVPKVSLDLTGNGSPVKLATSSDENSTQSASADTKQNQEVSLEALNAMGNLLSTGTIAFVHSMISATEMMHYGEPPTGSIETLPGLLIITQSQSAHREIADLLAQLEAAVE